MNRHPYEQDQRRADMDGGWSFDELCIVGVTFSICLIAAFFLLQPMLVPWS